MRSRFAQNAACNIHQAVLRPTASRQQLLCQCDGANGAAPCKLPETTPKAVAAPESRQIVVNQNQLIPMGNEPAQAHRYGFEPAVLVSETSFRIRAGDVVVVCGFVP